MGLEIVEGPSAGSSNGPIIYGSDFTDILLPDRAQEVFGNSIPKVFFIIAEVFWVCMQYVLVLG